jgi:hypothetical protein
MPGLPSGPYCKGPTTGNLETNLATLALAAVLQPRTPVAEIHKPVLADAQTNFHNCPNSFLALWNAHKPVLYLSGTQPEVHSMQPVSGGGY